MDTNQKTQQINTFAKGMDTDTSDMLLSNEAYRMANNLRYITDTESTTGELHLIEGLKNIEDLYPIPSGSTAKTISAILADEFNVSAYEIIATTTIRNYGVLIIKTDSYLIPESDPVEIKSAWFIFRIDINEEGSGLNPTLVFGPCLEALGNNWANKLSLVTRWESDDNVKVYIADGQHQVMFCNIVDIPNPVLTDISSIINSENIVLSQPAIDSIIPGSLEASLVAYSYRLYNYGGIYTNISPTTPFYKVNKSVHNINEGIPEGKFSTTGFKVKVSTLDSFNRVLLFRISYKENGQLPTIELIYDGKCYYNSNNPYDYISDFGREALAEFTLEEYNSASGILLSPSVIESKDDYLFAANIQYLNSKYLEAYLNWDARAVTSGDAFTAGGTKIILNGQISSSFINNPTAEYANENVNLSSLYNSRKWLNTASSNAEERRKLGGTGPNVSYSFITETVALDQDIFNAGVKPLSNQYTYTDPLYSASSKSLRRDELYRYGIILYSEDGYKFPVKWIADIRTPAMNAITLEIESGIISIDYSDDLTYWNKLKKHFKLSNGLKAEILGLKFDVSLPQGFVGYEIVRCNRGVNDRATVTQGVLSLLYYCPDGNYNTNILFPTGIVTLKKLEFLNPTVNEVDFEIISSHEYLLFFSPEICYLPDDINEILSNPKILPLMILHPFLCYYTDSLEVTQSPDYNSSANSLLNAAVEDLYYSPALEHAHPNQHDLNDWRYDFYLIKLGEQLGTFWHLQYIEQYTKIYKGDRLKDRNRIEYVKLYEYCGSSFGYGGESSNKLNSVYEVSDFAIHSEIPNYNDFADSTASLLSYDTKFAVLENKQYIPWVFPQSYLEDEGDLIAYLNSPSEINPAVRINYSVTGISDRCMLLKTTANQLTSFELIDKDYDINIPNEDINIFSTFLCNIRQGVTPYGGNTYSDRVNSLYYSHGQYFANDGQSAEVWDGDCFILCFEFVPVHQWYNPVLIYHANKTVIYSVPVETDIDIVNDYGSRYGRISSQPYATLLLDQPVDFAEMYQQTKPLYAYNTVYSTDPAVVINSSINEDIDRNYRFDTRIHYSNLKTNNEAIDSWTIFQPLNYLDVDSRHGAITDLRTFNNQLVFWQELATGLLSVNERTLITDDSNLPLILGTGGVLTRFDYITTKNGMKANLFTDVQSTNVLYWWDYDSHELCAYAGGLYTVLSKSKMVQNFINKQERLNRLSDVPLLTFDKKYNEVICKITTGQKHDRGSLVYNELLLQFTGLYDILPDHSLEYFDRVLLVKNYNTLIQGYTPVIAQWNVKSTNTSNVDVAYGFKNSLLLPYLYYVINDSAVYTKVYDNVEFAGTMYDGGSIPTPISLSASTLSDEIRFVFNTPLKLTSKIKGDKITNRQYDFKFVIPRAGYLDGVHEWDDWKTNEWGDRLRGKTMQCEMSSTSNSFDFSLQYIITKYRVSWS